ncbi:acyl-CoA dehydrogenase family protein [Sphaerisporangium rubeum]|uniref:Alkylation response protein AidB-like acyl-CoA dehydrogenase n=1 Tax=Sphaerisporangium rubeum TaxID=321317 RepID=A0A7X0IDN6_9ACTN|nr:acyl-CoA dehydrogenase family protein [Sphaerisporangium rubeum]MBB6473340.1 alkylation response protein AidB-like acyl-CoA dehydrogenase [Sphaerisporangium rubeum]
MDFSRIEVDDDLAAFVAEVRDFIATHVTEEVHEEERRTGGSFNLALHKALGAKGWILPRRPPEQGGAGLDRVRERVLELEMERAGAPDITLGTTRLVLTAVEKYAAPDLAAELVPKVARGDVRFCLGYSEPDGGSDIAAARTRAVRDGDQWTINGQKIFTTGAQNCQYTFLITRTDPDLPKHKGLTMFLVPLDSPGVEIGPIHTVGGERTNVVYYGDVCVSDRYRLGPVNGGWGVLRGPLDEEHFGAGHDDGLSDLGIGSSWARRQERDVRAAVRWARTARRPDGSRPIDDPRVRARLGQAALDVEASLATPGPMGRVRVSETMIEVAAGLVDLIGPEALLPHGADGCLEDGAFDYAHRFAQGTAIYGGTTEVFRNIIAQHVLGLPRPVYPGSRKLADSRGS